MYKVYVIHYELYIMNTILFEGVCLSQGHVIKGFLGRFWFQMLRIARMTRRAHHACSRGSGRKKNRWESSVSAMSKKKLHTYCVFETPNRYNPIVVTGQFAFLHTLQHF